MGRSLKPQQVDEFYYGRLAKHFKVMLDRNTVDFFVELAPNVVVRASSKDEVVRLAQERCKTLGAYEWKKVLLLEGPPNPEMRSYAFGASDAWKGTTVKVHFRRVEVSPHPGRLNSRIERPFEEDLPEGVQKDHTSWHYLDWESGKKATPFGGYGDGLVLPYNEDAWQTLLALSTQLQDLQKKYYDFVTQAEENPDLVLRVLKTRGAQLGFLLGKKGSGT
jgi:hypothetical protein